MPHSHASGAALPALARSLTLALTLALVLPQAAGAAVVVDGWTLDNVVAPAAPYVDDVTYSSRVYDRDVTGGTAGAVSNGAVIFTPPEATAPGIKVLTGSPDISASKDIPDCIMASSAATCESPFQSGKRLKLVMEEMGPIDLVFDTSGLGAAEYQLFAKLKNAIGDIGGFTMELGFGTGDDFVLAGALDGLSFAAVPDAPVTQFPFGLFGDAATSNNHDLDGFFAAETTGYAAAMDGATLSTIGTYGPYSEVFGFWTGIDDAPWGYFRDHDGLAETDAILMAWEAAPGVWEQRREEAGTEAAPITAEIVAEQDLIEAGYLLALVEDVSNLNVNALIAFSESYQAEGFTLRVAAAPVPLPAGAGLLFAGLAALGIARRRG